MNTEVDPINVENLPSFDDVGETGIYFLKRMFVSAQLNKGQGANIVKSNREWSLIVLVSDLLGVGLEATISKLYSCESFSEFEKWVTHCVPTTKSATVKQSINRAVESHFKEALSSNEGSVKKIASNAHAVTMATLARLWLSRCLQCH
ncbi:MULTISPECIES: hypothetical protein [unclassified Pseudoalteromonas]|uniref:hypothetical protein n=1 Tax=unclassified Pseudoalteromonas TaxID=194690 RepID=UPI0030156379